jgi:flagellar motor switch protein FliN/FliY
MEGHPAWPMISRLPAMLAVCVPLSRFKVCDLLNLECGQTIESAWAETEDVPLKAGALQLCWGEFEVVEQNKALRLTRLA